MSLYQSLLQPELYFETPKVARFVETLNEPEIESASRDQLQQLKKEMMATDDIKTLVEDLVQEAQEAIYDTGTMNPHFVCYTDKEHRTKFKTGKCIPSSLDSIKKFLRAGKALGMSRAAQCTFFTAMQPVVDDKPAFGDNIADPSLWGILVIGSSLRGNCFVHLETMLKNLEFKTVYHNILREGQYNYPYSKFFHIENYKEMESVIEQMLKFSSDSMSEKECLINFATTLKALDFFGYSKKL
jgi:hypothetical protein